MARTKTREIPEAGTGDGMDRKRRMSLAVMDPVTAHAVLRQSVLGVIAGTDLDQGAIMETLGDGALDLKDGSLDGLERMLFAQASSLNGVFICMAQRSAQNLGEYLPAAVTYMKLALKAQSQCRATLETLAAIKNPPVIYARQANFANGPQQVNNGDPTRASENQNAPNELLEVQNEGERLDLGTPGQASGGDPALASMGKIDGTANEKR